MGRRVAIIGGSRIPFARSNTAYSTKSNQEMLTAALKGLVDKYQLHGARIGEGQAGAVLKHSRDVNLTRESVLSSGLAPETVGADVQMACGTGLQAAINIANKIALGQIESGIAGGVDTTSDAPIAVGEKLRKILLEANRGKTTGDKLKAIAKIRPSMLAPAIPTNGEPRTRKSMGEHCEDMAKEWKIRREDQDQLAYESHNKAARAWESGFYADLIVPFGGLERDNNLRPDIQLEKLATLGPVFDRKSGNGTLTAANSTPL
ncbi:UNVERIFIED_CONTAM: acetyl-CoA C-acyltransferase, partial [Salmonella enterica subsp. enterica serovar Weltevreden]